MSKGFLSRYIYPIGISAVVLVLALANHIPGTWLLGWDSLSDEFNFKINAQRQFFGVWNEYQGLGTAGGHAHASDIPRFLYLWLASFILPDNVLRYSYFFFTLLVGAIGMFYLSKYLFKNRSNKKLLALIATSFYIFNLGTLQIFYVPFEMFNAQFMVLPWIFLYVIKFIRHANFKDYLYLCLFIVLGTPQGYAPVLYYALIGSVAGFLFIYLLIHNNRLQVFLRSLLVGAAFIFLNLYWILPNLYYIRNYSDSVSASKINSLFSEEAFLYSTKWGTLLDFPILRGFLFGWLDYKHATGETYYLMDYWRIYMANPLVLGLGLLFFAIIIVGLAATILKRKAILISFVPVFLLWLFMVIGANGILFPIWSFLREHIELFREGLRFPYSKFSILLQFGYSIFFVYGLIFILDLIEKRKIERLHKIRAYVLWIFAVVPALYMFPFFTGNLIAREMQVNLAPEYPALFEKFANEDPNKRILYLPANNLFGWQYYDWGGEGYQGAGFVWFGLAQSFVTRDFDRWHPANETLYQEIQYAIYNNDTELFSYLLNKYDISYIILDKNIIAPNNTRSLFFKETEDLLSNTENLALTDTINKVVVYERNDLTPSQKYVKLVPTINASRNIKIESDPGYYDSNYLGNTGDFFESEFFTISDLSDALQNNELEVNLSETARSYGTYEMYIPYGSRTEAIPVQLSLENTVLRMKYLYPEIYNNTDRLIASNNYEEVFSVSPIESSQILINNVLINSNTLNAAALIDEDSKLVEFSRTNTGVFNFSDTVFNTVATDCSTQEETVAKFYAEFPGSIGMETGDGVTGCLNFRDRINNSSPTIYKVSFEYNNSDSAIPMYCLSDSSTGNCLNKQYEQRPASSPDSFNYYEDYVLVEDPTNLSLVIVLASDDSQADEVSAVFRRIQIERFETTSIRTLFDPSIRFANAKVNISASDFPLKIKLPDYSALSTKYIPGSQKFNSSVRNCDQLNANNYSRTLVQEDGSPAYIYDALDAISCDTLEATIINPRSSYLVGFDTQKLSGQGLDVCLWGINTERCLLQERLQGGLETYLLPSYSSSGGVNINLNNTSIGRINTTNKVSSIDVNYFPYAWLKGLYIVTDKAQISTENPGVSVNKDWLYKYRFTVDNKDVGNNVILGVNQAYDSGWVLLDRSSCFIGLEIPNLCRSPEKSHFLYNGWANGWYFTAESAQYTAIFWPQLLQNAGYIIFTVYIGLIMLISSYFSHKSAK